MNVPERVSPEQIKASYESTGSIRGTMRALHVSHATVIQALGRTRKAEEFKGLSARAVDPPRLEQGPYAWSLELIRAARDEQLAGCFKRPVRLAEAIRTDDALFVAYHARLAPLSSLATRLDAGSGTRGEVACRRATEHVIVPRTTIVGLAGTLANHGIAIGCNRQEVSDDGTRVTFRHEEWPLEHVRWNSSTGELQTATRGGLTETIVHGDGFWTVYRKFGVKPWTQDACLLPAALIWAAHANAIKSWSWTSDSHAIANKLMGELPPGVAMQKADGTLTAEASAFLNMMSAIASGQSPAGIRPSGAKTDFMSNTSTAAQVFETLVQSREKAAARVYTGTDAILGSVGGAPGVDISQLFGVTTTIVQGDAEAIEMGLWTGVYQPWAAVNDGDSRHAPTFRFELPDPDAEQESKQNADRQLRLATQIKTERDAGCVVTQERVNALAKEYGVRSVPIISAPAPPPPVGGSENSGPKGLTALANWEESKHPRADDGKFGAGGDHGGTEISDHEEAHAQVKADLEDAVASIEDAHQARVSDARDRYEERVIHARNRVPDSPEDARAEHAQASADLRDELDATVDEAILNRGKADYLDEKGVAAVREQAAALAKQHPTAAESIHRDTEERIANATTPEAKAAYEAEARIVRPKIEAKFAKKQAKLDEQLKRAEAKYAAKRTEAANEIKAARDEYRAEIASSQKQRQAEVAKARSNAAAQVQKIRKDRKAKGNAKDRDGDGRTGDAEAKDDAEQT